MKLDEEKQKALKIGKEPLLILAGAGSGKTTILVERINKMLNNGIPPQKILAITFTRKAANELKERIKKRTGKNLYYATTFHSWGNMKIKKLLKKGEKISSSVNKFLSIQTGYEISLTPDYKIVFPKDALKMLREKYNNVNSEDLEHIEHVFFAGEKLKQAGINLSSLSSDEFIQNFNENFYNQNYPKSLPEPSEIYISFQQEVYNQNKVFISDLLLFPYLLMKTEKLHPYFSNYEAIFVDEFQDVNLVQYNIVRLLTKNHKNITVVGDAQQNIYEWRGSDFRFIKKFQEDYNPHIVFLSKNYRSSSYIVNIANKVSENLDLDLTFQMKAHHELQGHIKIEKLFDQEEEIEKILDYIQKIKQEEESIGILYRLNIQRIPLELSLIDNNIPYHVAGKRSLWEVWNTLLENLNEKDSAFIKSTIYLTAGKSIPSEVFFTAYEDIMEEDLDILLDWQDKKTISPDDIKKTKFIGKMNSIKKMVSYNKSLPKEGFFFNINIKQYPLKIQQLWKEFNFYIKKARTAKQFIYRLYKSKKLTSTNNPHITLSTIHMAKGLEWDTVFILDVNNGILPTTKEKEKDILEAMRIIQSADNIEEEKRLFYTAITRAKRNLFIYSTDYVELKYGINVEFTPSPFLDIIRDAINEQKKEGEKER